MEDIAFLSLLFNEPIYVVEDISALATIAPTSTNSFTTNQQSTIIQPSNDTPKALRFYGMNKNKVLIVVEIRTPDFLKTQEYLLLDKIMQSVLITMNEMAIVNLAETGVMKWEDILQRFAPEKLLLFGVSPLRIGIRASFPINQPTLFEQTQILSTHTLTDLGQADKDKKMALWEGLKRLFLIKS